MQELVRENRPVCIRRKTDVSGPIGMSEARRHDSKKIKELFETVPGKHELKEKDEHVYKNQCTRNYRHGAARDGILNWKHLGAYLSDQRHQLVASI